MAKKFLIDLPEVPIKLKNMLAGTKSGINECRLIDDAPIIHELFDELDNFFSRKDDDELPHQLLNPRIREIWVRLIGFLAGNCTIPESSTDCKDDKSKVDYLALVFEIRSIFQRLQDLAKKYDDGFIRMARLYGSHYDYEGRDIISSLFRWGYYPDDEELEEERQSLDYLDQQIKKLNSNLKPIYYNVNHIIQSYVDYCWELLEKVIPSDKEIQDFVEIAFKDYCKEFRNDAMRKLKQDVQRYKPYRSAPPSPEVWGEVLRAEDEVLDLAIKGDRAFIDSTDKRFEYYGEDTRKLMEKNSILLKKIQAVALDERLFDLEYASQAEIKLIDILTSENLNLFLDLILRRNLIQCEMYPKLKTEFESWLKQRQTEDNKTAEDGHVSEMSYELSIVPEDKQHLFMKPDKFDAYCRVLKGDMKTFMDTQGNKALWDVVNFYSMLYGFFPKNISRENAAAFFVSIIPELGEAKALSSSMAKCNIASKKKLEKYDTLSPTDDLKAYEENIGKWIKEIP